MQYFVLIAALAATAAEARKITVVNKCTETIWPGMSVDPAIIMPPLEYLRYSGSRTLTTPQTRVFCPASRLGASYNINAPDVNHLMLTRLW
jgi:hypothetical protein